MKWLGGVKSAVKGQHAGIRLAILEKGQAGGGILTFKELG
jgi:hypothetical protein